MADSEVFFPSNYAGRHNNKSHLPCKATTKYPKGTLVARDNNGRAARPAAGLKIHGISEGDFDNTASGPNGDKGNDAFNVEMSVGVGEFDYDGTAPKADQVVYAVDNHTVSLDSDSGTRGVAGVCTETGSGGKVMVYVDPVLNGALASGLSAVALQVLSLAIGFADLTEADGSQTFNFGSALPANAILLGRDVDVTEGFTDGVAGVFTLDVGTADVDAIIDGAAIGTIAVVSGPNGVRHSGAYGGVTPTATVLADVNVTTATAGAMTINLYYLVLG